MDDHFGEGDFAIGPEVNMSVLTTKTFWADTVERMVKTFAQAALAQLSAGAVGLLEVNYTTLLSVAGLASLISLLTSIASAGTGNSASLVGDLTLKNEVK